MLSGYNCLRTASVEEPFSNWLLIVLSIFSLSAAFAASMSTASILATVLWVRLWSVTSRKTFTATDKIVVTRRMAVIKEMFFLFFLFLLLVFFFFRILSSSSELLRISLSISLFIYFPP